MVSPNVDEAALTNELPIDTALRLSQRKALSVAADHPQALIIGSDQVASLHGKPMSKPGHHAAAVAQLQAMSGETVLFHTGLSVHHARSGQTLTHVVTTTVRLRTLSDTQIDHYLNKDQPYHCAGSARVESLGIALMESVQDEDPTALIGLPLITLTRMLAKLGVDVLTA